MKKLNANKYLTLVVYLSCSSLMAATDLASNAKKLGNIVDNVGVVLVSVFLGIAGLYVASGSQEGTRKFSYGLIGTILFFCAGALVAALKVLK